MSKQISQLNSTNELNDNDIFPVVNDNTTKKLSFANLKTLLAQLFITNETDPTVPSWAKASKKPSYSTSELTNDSGFITKEVNDLTNYELKTKTGSTIEFSIDNTTHNITLKLKNSNGDILSEKTIQLEDFVTKSDFETFTTKLNQVLQELDETKADAEDVEALQTRVTELRQQVTDLENNQLTNTPTPATSHCLQDSADSRFRKFIPIGRTTQESTTGKNKLPVTGRSEGSNGVITTLNKDGSVTISGTLTANWFVIGEGNIDVSLPAGQYTFSTKEALPFNVRLDCTYEDDTVVNVGTITKGNTSRTFTLEQAVKKIFIETTGGTSGTTYNLTLYLQLETGSSATEWERYTGGEPAPNPNYPYAIKNTGDNVNEIASFIQPSYNRYEDILDAEIPNINDLLGQKITISFMSDKVGTIYENGNVFTTSETRNIVVGRNSFTFTFKNEIPVNSDTYSNGKLRLLKNSVTTNTCVFTEVKLKQGTKATPYSPYGCGNVNEKIENKNLALVNSKTITGTTNATGQVGSIEGTVIVKDIPIENNTKYYISGQFPSQLTDAFKIFLYNGKLSATTHNGAYTELVTGNRGIQSGNNITEITNSANYEYMAITTGSRASYSASTSVTINIDKLMASTSSDTSYVPHSEQNISFPLKQGQKLMEGDYPDDDEKVHHKRGEIALNGTEDWREYAAYHDNGGNGYCYNLVNSNFKIGVNTSVCTHFKNIGSYNAFDPAIGYIGAYSDHPTIGRKYFITDKETITEWKAYLAEQYANGIPVKLQYELAEEQTEDFTEEQKTAWEQIKKARTYKNVTHISSEDETPANVEIEYVVDINTIDDRITALEAKVDLLEE